jgi:antitoxin VapB
MRKVSIFYNRNAQAIRLPKDFELPGATELAIEKHGDVVTLRPVRPNWGSFFESPPPDGADAPMRERAELIDQDRFGWMRGER